MKIFKNDPLNLRKKNVKTFRENKQTVELDFNRAF